MAKTKTKTKAAAAPAAEDSLTRVRVGDPDDIYEIDLDDLDHGEASEIERLMDRPLPEIWGTPWRESVQFTTIIAWLAKRRSEPNTTFAEVRALKIGEIDVVEESRPTQTAGANGDQAGSKSAASEHGSSDDSQTESDT